MSQNIKASEIKPGMVIRIYGDDINTPVAQARDNGFGAIEIHNGIRWYGLSTNETVTVVGRYNP